MGKNDALIRLRVTDVKYVYIKKRKAGVDINAAVAEGSTGRMSLSGLGPYLANPTSLYRLTRP